MRKPPEADPIYKDPFALIVGNIMAMYFLGMSDGYENN
jgi:hypothetical protein